MPLPFYHIDVFTRVPYQGNPASVLVGTAAFAEQQMQAIAREIGLPGNGFVWPVPGEPDTFHLRFWSCTSPLRIIPSAQKPGKMPHLTTR
jgi:PhzF family phenazine biosynthesis protein